MAETPQKRQCAFQQKTSERASRLHLNPYLCMEQTAPGNAIMGIDRARKLFGTNTFSCKIQ